MTLKEIFRYSKNMKELEAFRAFGMTPAEYGKLLEEALYTSRETVQVLEQFKRYLAYGITPDNVHLFEMRNGEWSPLPLDLKGE